MCAWLFEERAGVDLGLVTFRVDLIAMNLLGRELRHGLAWGHSEFVVATSLRPFWSTWTDVLFMLA